MVGRGWVAPSRAVTLGFRPFPPMKRSPPPSIAHELINEKGRQVGAVDMWFYLVQDTDLSQI